MTVYHLPLDRAHHLAAVDAPPADAFAHARLAETFAPPPPASQAIGDTVARWRERDASAVDELLLTDVIADIDDGNVERDFALIFAFVLILWIVGGVALAVARGAH